MPRRRGPDRGRSEVFLASLHRLLQRPLHGDLLKCPWSQQLRPTIRVPLGYFFYFATPRSAPSNSTSRWQHTSRFRRVRGLMSAWSGRDVRRYTPCAHVGLRRVGHGHFAGDGGWATADTLGSRPALWCDEHRYYRGTRPIDVPEHGLQRQANARAR